MRAYRKHMAVGLCIVILLSCLAYQADASPITTSASRSIPNGKSITLNQAKSLALSNSSEYSSLQSKLALAQVQYAQAVKSIQLRKKNQSTFRWTPLLSFKFPEKADLSDAFEYTYKPLELQSEIDTIKHQMTNNKYDVYEEVSLLFVECYTLQESIQYTETRLEDLQTSLSKNQARLASGQANQSDIDKIESSITSLNSQLTGDMRSFETAKNKLSDCINLNVRSGYTFQNPYVTANISRSQYNYILSYTLERDESLYEARVDTSNALLALDTNYQLMKNQYGSKMELIDTFVNQVKNGEKVDTAAFRLKYDEFLQKVDEPWQGKFRILFVKIPKEWTKGSIDGVRYVEDEPYALYEAALDYQDTRLDEQQVQKDLETQVSDGFDNYISVRQTYETLVQNVADKKQEVEKSVALNLTGKLTYDELSDLQAEYADLQMEELEALSDYTSVLVSYDKLTCGAVSTLLKGTGVDLNSSEDGMSYIVADEEEGAYYYIHSLASDNAFEFGIYIPSDFSVEITDYELWVNGTQIGERTSVDKTIKHLALTIDSVDSCFVRLYSGSEFVDDCTIDTEVYSGELIITTGYTIQNDSAEVIGTYETSTSQTTGLVTLTIKTDNEAIKYYNIKTAEGTYLSSDKKLDIQAKFKYLGLVAQDIGDLTFCFYDANGSLLYECSADTTNKEFIEITSGE